MPTQLVLLDKLYNIWDRKRRKSILNRYSNYLNEKIGSFPNTEIFIKRVRESDDRVEIIVDGEDEVFVSNIIKNEIGAVRDFGKLQTGETYLGKMVEVGKVGFGIFVDCGIVNPKSEVLINLHTLREQLVGTKEVSVRKIINAYDFIDHFPLYVKINKIDPKNNDLLGLIDESSVNLFGKLLRENLEAIFLSGETKGQLKKALVRQGHLRDIASIERYGFLENIVVLREGTQAPGIIAKIGKYLKGCNLAAIRPKRIKQLRA
jgi:hypothetical protein